MYHNPTQMDSYNKYPDRNAQGTLIANWAEERELRGNQGQGRSFTQTHIPKLHETLLNEDPQELSKLQRPSFDNTSYRTMGYRGEPQIGKTENYFYGKGTNKADAVNRIGPKQQLLQEMYLHQIKTEFATKTKDELMESQKREFNTTNRDTFVKHSLEENVIGRRVMNDQNGNKVPFNHIDEDLKTDHGFYERKQITPDQQLRKLFPQGEHYSKQQPITFWREKLTDGNFYMSKTNAVNTGSEFNKNNDFLKTFKHYKHYKD